MGDFLYDLFYVLPFSLLLALEGKRFLPLPESQLRTCLAAFILSLIIAGIKHAKRSVKLLVVGIPLAVFATVILVTKKEERYELILQMRWVGALLVVVLLCFALAMIMTRYIWVRRLLAGASLGLLLYELTRHIRLEKISVSLLFFFLLFVCAEEVQMYWKKSGYTEAKQHMVNVAPFLLLICLAIIRIPAPNTPYHWDYAKALWDKTVTQVNRIGGLLFHTDDFAEMGFADTGVIGNQVEETDQVILEISGSANMEDVVYLAGKVFDTFNGREWTAKASIEENGRILDYLETRHAVMNMDEGTQKDYLDKVKLIITYKGNNTKYLFLPANALYEGEALTDIAYEDSGQSLTADKPIAYGTTYQTYYYKINRNPEYFSNLLDRAKEVSKASWEASISEKSLKKAKRYQYENYQNYMKSIYRDYGKQVEISESLRSILDDVMLGAKSDLERLERLEQWLSSMDYTKSVGDLPKDIKSEGQYLDYFLTQSQEGYCIHFATAFTLLARAEGFPARYVQGYRANCEKNKTIEVTSRMAHAWPEVYIANVGWIAFEPTPGFALSFGWEGSSNGETASSGSGSNYQQKGPIPAEQEDGLETEEEEPEKQRISPVTILIALVAGMLFFLTFLLLGHFVANLRYRKKTSREKVLYLCHRLMRIYAMRGLPIQKSETLEEYEKRLQSGLPEEDIAFLLTYEALSYTDRNVTEEMLEKIEISYKEKMELLRKRNIWLWLRAEFL